MRYDILINSQHCPTLLTCDKRYGKISSYMRVTSGSKDSREDTLQVSPRSRVSQSITTKQRSKCIISIALHPIVQQIGWLTWIFFVVLLGLFEAGFWASHSLQHICLDVVFPLTPDSHRPPCSNYGTWMSPDCRFMRSLWKNADEHEVFVRKVSQRRSQLNTPVHSLDTFISTEISFFC